MGKSVARLFLLIFFKIEIVVFFVELFKQAFGVFAPCTEMVLVEYDYIPICGVNKFVFRLYAARVVSTEQILKRTEYHDGQIFIAGIELLI